MSNGHAQVSWGDAFRKDIDTLRWTPNPDSTRQILSRNHKGTCRQHSPHNTAMGTGPIKRTELPIITEPYARSRALQSYTRRSIGDHLHISPSYGSNWFTDRGNQGNWVSDGFAKFLGIAKDSSFLFPQVQVLVCGTNYVTLVTHVNTHNGTTLIILRPN